MTLNPFTITIPESVLLDLRQRLNNVRWPDEVRGVSWDYGSNLDYLKELLASFHPLQYVKSYLNDQIWLADEGL